MKERCGRCEEYKPSEAGHSGRLATINIVPEIKRQEKMIPVTESRARESCCFMRLEQVKLRLLQVNFVFIIFYLLSTISFSLQLHLKKPWVRGKSLRGFSLAAMTALLMSCSPSWPMAKMMLSTYLLSILFNNNLLDKSQGKEKRESNMPSISKWGNTVIQGDFF